MSNSEIIAIISIVAALTSATLVSYFNYRFGLTTKKREILFTNQMQASKELVSVISKFKYYCLGKIAFLEANEYSPFYEDGVGAMQHRIDIAKTLEGTEIFFVVGSKKAVIQLLNSMGGLCSGEASSIIRNDLDASFIKEYERMADLAEKTISTIGAAQGISK